MPRYKVRFDVVLEAETPDDAARAALLQVAQSKRCEVHQVQGDVVTYLDVEIGDPFVRDADAECTEFVRGKPDQYGGCDGDGHYLCGECEKHRHCEGCAKDDLCGDWVDGEDGGCGNYDEYR